jgi:hypothetical protein
VPQVPPTVGACDLRTLHAVRVVHMAVDRPGDLIVEGGPAAPAVELGLGPESMHARPRVATSQLGHQK